MSMSESSTKASAPRDAMSDQRDRRDRRDRQTKRWFVAVALSRSRLAQLPLSRIGFVSGMSLALSLVAFAVIQRATDGSAATLDGLIDVGAGAIACVAAAPTTLAAATDRRTADREGGIEALSAMRGVHVAHLELVRTYAGMVQIARTTALPLITLGVAIAALASSGSMALRRVGMMLGLVVFAGMVGVVLGSVAALSARIGGRRGKLTVSAIVLLPWIIGELFGRGIYSIPGALDAALSLILDIGRYGVGA
jgi:multisubunit Na+/H+ antiporter MnhG subunit